MKKVEIIVVVILFVAVIGFSYWYNSIYSDYTDTVCFGEKCFSVEVAETKTARWMGLMFRESLPENSGMLFVFPEKGVYGFWMKDTLIPLDIIWINKNREVVFIKRNALPCIEEEECLSINPEAEALYVLEVNAGVTEEIGLKIGDRVRFK